MLNFIYILLIFIIPAIPLFIFKLWYWFYLVLSMALLTGIFEIIAIINTEETISQHFSKFVKKNKIKSLFILGAFLISVIMLTVHLWLKIP